jgi:hypothetical protein
MIPHVTSTRQIHTRAPTLCRMRLLGTSNRKYPRKKMPAPSPYTLVAELEVAHHLQLGEAHVHAVDVRDDVRSEEDRQNPPRDLAIERIGAFIARGEFGAA